MKLLLILLFACACGHEAPCDPGQIYEHGLCYAPPDAGVTLDAP
jgi:hypothetical protein